MKLKQKKITITATCIAAVRREITKGHRKQILRKEKLSISATYKLCAKITTGLSDEEILMAKKGRHFSAQ